MGKQFNCPLGSIHSSHEEFPYFSLSSWYSFKKDSTSFLSFLMLMFFSPFHLKDVHSSYKNQGPCGAFLERKNRNALLRAVDL
jgi:hypothetical protein